MAINDTIFMEWQDRGATVKMEDFIVHLKNIGMEMKAVEAISLRQLAGEKVSMSLRGMTAAGEKATVVLKGFAGALGVEVGLASVSMTQNLAATEAKLKKTGETAKAASTKMLEFFRAQNGTQVDVPGVPGGEKVLANYKAQISALRQLTDTYAKERQAELTWTNAAAGRIVTVAPKYQALATQVLRVRAAYQALTAAQMQATASAKAAAQAAANATLAQNSFNGASISGLSSYKAHQAQANQLAKEFTLTWKTFVRLAVFSLVRRGVYQLVSAMRQAITDATELSIRIAEIQGISQHAQLTTVQWSSGLKQLSNSFGLDVLDAAEAGYQALSNQIAEGADALHFLNEAARFSVISNSSLTDSTLLLTAALNSQGSAVENTREVADKFFKIIELGRIRGSELSNTWGRVAVTANLMGVSLTEMGAFLTQISIRGVNVSESMTQLRGLFQKLISPTKAGTRFFRSLGVESIQAAVRLYGFAGVMKKLGEYTSTTDDELIDIITRIRGFQAAVIGTGFTEGIVEAEQEIDKAATDSAAAFKLAMEATGRVLRIEGQKIKNFFKVDLGLQAVDSLAKLTQKLGGMEAAVLTLRDAIVAIAATAGLGAIIHLGKILASLGPIGLAAAAAIAVTVPAVIALRHEINKMAAATQRWANETDTAYAEATLAIRKQTQDMTDSVIKGLGSRGVDALKGVAEVFLRISDNTAMWREEVEAIEPLLKANIATSVTSLTTELQKQEAALKGMANNIEDAAELITSTSKQINALITEFEIADLDPAAKFQKLQQLKKGLQNKVAVAAGDKDIPTLRALRDEYINIIRQQKTLGDEIRTTNKTTAKEVAENLKKQQEVSQKAQAAQSLALRKAAKEQSKYRVQLTKLVADVQLDTSKTTEEKLEASTKSHTKRLHAIYKKTDTDGFDIRAAIKEEETRFNAEQDHIKRSALATAAKTQLTRRLTAQGHSQRLVEITTERDRKFAALRGEAVELRKTAQSFNPLEIDNVDIVAELKTFEREYVATLQRIAAAEAAQIELKQQKYREMLSAQINLKLALDTLQGFTLKDADELKGEKARNAIIEEREQALRRVFVLTKEIGLTTLDTNLLYSKNLRINEILENANQQDRINKARDEEDAVRKTAQAKFQTLADLIKESQNAQRAEAEIWSLMQTIHPRALDRYNRADNRLNRKDRQANPLNVQDQAALDFLRDPKSLAVWDRVIAELRTSIAAHAGTPEQQARTQRLFELMSKPGSFDAFQNLRQTQDEINANVKELAALEAKFANHGVIVTDTHAASVAKLKTAYDEVHKSITDLIDAQAELKILGPVLSTDYPVIPSGSVGSVRGTPSWGELEPVQLPDVKSSNGGVIININAIDGKGVLSVLPHVEKAVFRQQSRLALRQ